MTQELEGLFNQIQSASDLADLQIVTLALRQYFKVDHAVYHWVNSAGERFGTGTYSQAWVDRYLERDYMKIDPVITGCFQRFDPVDWKQLDWTSRPAKAFLQEAISYGVGNQGFSIPIRGPAGQFALFTLSHRCDDETWSAFVEANRRDMLLVAHEMNRRALSFDDFDGEVHPALSPRELSAMTYLAKGLSRAQAAAEMEISEHTLRVYIEAARHKLGALNTTHAVARALSRGLIVV